MPYKYIQPDLDDSSKWMELAYPYFHKCMAKNRAGSPCLNDGKYECVKCGHLTCRIPAHSRHAHEE